MEDSAKWEVGSAKFRSKARSRGGGNPREVHMAANFRIFTHLNSENLHLPPNT
jgi:hypothetical protein